MFPDPRPSLIVDPISSMQLSNHKDGAELITNCQLVQQEILLQDQTAADAGVISELADVPVLSQSAREANKTCVGDHQNSLDDFVQNLGDLTAEQLAEHHPNAVVWLSRAVIIWSYPNALNQLAPMLNGMSLSHLLSMHPLTLYWSAAAAVNGYPYAFNVLAMSIHRLSQLEIKKLLIQIPTSLTAMAMAARKGHTVALLAACPVLEAMSVDEFLHLDDGALEQVAAAAACGHDCLLISLSPLLSQLTADQFISLSGATLHNLACAASSGHPQGLQSIAPVLAQLTDEQFKQYIPRHLSELAHAAARGSPEALNVIAPRLSQLCPAEINTLLPDAIQNIMQAAEAGAPDALIHIAPLFLESGHSFLAKHDPENQLRATLKKHRSQHSSGVSWSRFFSCNAVVLPESRRHDVSLKPTGNKVSPTFKS